MVFIPFGVDWKMRCGAGFHQRDQFGGLVVSLSPSISYRCLMRGWRRFMEADGLTHILTLNQLDDGPLGEHQMHVRHA